MNKNINWAIHELDRQRRIRADENNELERLAAIATNTSGGGYGDELPRGSHTGDKLERAAINLSELRDEIKRERRNRSPDRFKALKILQSNLDEGAAYVAVAIHDRGLTYNKIAAETGYSVRWVYLQDEKARGKR